MRESTPLINSPIEINWKNPELVQRLEQEYQVAANRVALISEELKSAEKELGQAEMALLHLRLQAEADYLRNCEQAFQNNIPWYIPLEGIIEMPIIGIDRDEFIAVIKKHNHMSAHFHDKQTDRFSLHINLNAKDKRQHSLGAQVGVFVLPDNTLRPQSIYGYNKLLVDSATSQDKNINIELIGRSKTWWKCDCDAIEAETMVVTRYKGDHKHRWGEREIYDKDGQMLSTGPFEPDFSGELS